MTEQNLNDVNSSNQNLNQGMSSAPSEVPAEKMVRQSDVDAIIKGAKLDAYNKGRNEAMSDWQKQTPTTQPTAQPAMHQQQSMGGMSQVTPEQIRQMIAEEAPKALAHQVHAANVQRFAQEFSQKVLAGKDKYPDYEEVVGSLNLPKMAETNPALLYLTNATDNTHDVLYDLGKNPQKVATIMALASNPATQHLAQSEMQKISNSIKTNQTAASQPSPNEPLSQVQHSATGTDNGALSVRDYRKQDWLRG